MPLDIVWLDFILEFNGIISCGYTSGFGGIFKLLMSPSSISTTLIIEGRSVGFNCIHQSATIIIFFTISFSSFVTSSISKSFSSTR
ncbi:hypothetical protein Fmac_032399 [Flemingia macrophylla]|uniref:Uncharacterized protein n=1 Tax=Flemingia macrophylla TaxID=520843 RepID=A0ABD1L4S1_9FABA